MSISIPIHKIAKDLGIDSSRVISACETLGIEAKGSSKKLKEDEVNKIIEYFETGKNVSNEVVLVNDENKEDKTKAKQIKYQSKDINYFPNRLIG